MIQDSLLMVFAITSNPSMSIVNVIAMLNMTANQGSNEKVQAELDAFFAETAKAADGKSAEEAAALYEAKLASRTPEDLEFTSLCFDESMRLEAPFAVTTQ